VTAIPAGQLQPSVLRDVIRQVGRQALPPPVPVFGFGFGFGFGEVLLAEVKSVKPVWLLIEISNASQNRMGILPYLARRCSGRGSTRTLRFPVMVLTDTMPERRAAENLGFVERRTWGRRWPWWLGGGGPDGVHVRCVIAGMRRSPG
jgi:hypothetical protein